MVAVPASPDDEELTAPGDPEAVARIVCLRLLDRRARTRAELRTALASAASRTTQPTGCWTASPRSG